jgi:hypothetical protein
MSVSNRNRLLRLRRERGSATAAARALSVSASTVKRWLDNGVPDARKAILKAKTKRYYPPPPPPSKKAKSKKKAKPKKRAAPSQIPAAVVEVVLGFERGPEFVSERKKLRFILQREPSVEEVERMVAQLPPKKREVLSFHDVMERAYKRGVLDHAMFERIAKHFHVNIHDVYNVFFGYPPSVGKVA